MNRAQRTRLERLENTPGPEEALRAVVVQIEYDAYEDEPPIQGEQYTLYLPAKAPSVEAWYRATAPFRARLRLAPEGRE